MHRILCFLLPCLVPFTWTALPAPQSAQPAKTETAVVSEPSNPEEDMIPIQITAGDTVLSAKLYDNPTTHALLEQMPLTITMDELNGNEKFYYLPHRLPTNPQQPTEIKSGDLMLYGSDCFVLFYESFPTSYRYTSLGYVENASALSAILGNGSITLTFQTE